MVSLLNLVTLALGLASTAVAIPSYASLAGLPREELDSVILTLDFRPPLTPAGPLKFNGTKLVNDARHPWKLLRKGDIRGPCPGLNTIASHGYLPRNGIARPAEIVHAVMEGFNMESTLAKFITYAAHLVDGNLVTDKLSIGRKTPKTGPNPPAPAIVGGLNTHAVFEGDSSMTRGNAFFGDNHSFNETLFDQFVAFSNKFGGRKYSYAVAAELRFQRIKQSIATNPTFTFVSPRFFTAYAESVFPVNFFVDGRKGGRQLDLVTARGFFQDMCMPKNFHRANQPSGVEGIDDIAAVHPVQPGDNAGKVNDYVFDPTSADFSTFCLLYENFVNKTIGGLYPNPKGALRKALNINLNFFFEGIGNGCTQVFPYGKDD